MTPPRETAPDERSGQARAAKRAIGRWAAGQVGDGETLLLDAGTTTAALAGALSSRDLTVVTTGLTPLQALDAGTHREVVCLGGHYRAISQGFVGPVTEAALEVFTFDRVFLGADGVSPERGLCEATVAQTRLKELMWRRGREVYVLADSSKLGSEPFNAWVRMPPRWTLVTDDGVEDALVARLERAGAVVVAVPAADRHLPG
nr:hypothetical protein [Auraticoccus cholistanensis]